jgi:hypothetical protein
MIAHTLKDLDSMDSNADRAMARGMVEHAGMVACSGLPRFEFADLDQIVGLSQREIDLIASWSSPPDGAPTRARYRSPASASA